MRQDSNRLVLNAQIWAGMNPEKVTARAVRVTATNHAKAALTGFKAGDKEGAPTNEVFLIKVRLHLANTDDDAPGLPPRNPLAVAGDVMSRVAFLCGSRALLPWLPPGWAEGD